MIKIKKQNIYNDIIFEVTDLNNTDVGYTDISFLKKFVDIIFDKYNINEDSLNKEYNRRCKNNYKLRERVPITERLLKTTLNSIYEYLYCLFVLIYEQNNKNDEKLSENKLYNSYLTDIFEYFKGYYKQPLNLKQKDTLSAHKSKIYDYLEAFKTELKSNN